MTEPFRCGDHVHHAPTGEDWLVAWCEGPDLAPCGWPTSVGRTADCTLIKRATDDEHRRLVAEFERSGSGHRGHVLRLYGPTLAAADALENWRVEQALRGTGENGCGNG